MDLKVEDNQITNNAPSNATPPTKSNTDKTFTKRKGTADFGKDYKNYLMANLALNLTSNDSIQNFYVWSNDEKFGAFDDVIIETQSNDSIKCAVQLKHVMKTEKQLSSESLTGDKGNFSIKKYFQSFQKYKSSLSDYELILFTNLKFNPDENMELQLSDKENFTIRIFEVEGISWFNTCRENNKCYRFEIIQKDGEQLSTTLKNYKKFFDNFFVYANQISVDVLKNQIYKQMETSYSCKEDISFTFLNFFGKWNLQEGIKEKLHKTMVKRLIALQLVSSSIRPISFGAVSSHRQIFQNAMLNFDVTVFEKNSADHLEKIWVEDRNSIDAREISIVNKNYQLTVDRFDKIENLSDLECTKLLWLMGKCPLILNESPSVHEVFNLGIDRGFILLREKCTNEDLNKYSVFHKLIDLKPHEKIYSNIISNFKCLVSGKEIDLEQIVEDNEMQNILTTTELLSMVDGIYEVKQQLEHLPIPYISRQLSRNIIDLRFLDDIDTESLVLITNVNSNARANFIQKYKAIDAQKFLVSNPATFNDFNKKPILLIAEGIISVKTFRRICEKLERKTCHHFKIYNGMLEWIGSAGNILNLQQFRMENYYMEEEELEQMHSENNIHLVTGDPGLGKTWLLKHLRNKFSSKTIATIFTPHDMKKICAFLESNKKNLDVLEDYIIQMKYSNGNKLDQCIMKSLIHKNAVIYFWDALDEIVSEKNLNTIIELILKLSEKGIVHWVTCRKHLRPNLESRLGVLSRILLEFNKLSQIQYIQKRLECIYPDQNDLSLVIKKIMENVATFQTKDILSIPMQIFMLTEICLNDKTRMEDLLKDTISLADIYEKFVEDKFIFRYKKQPSFYSSDVDDLEEEKNAVIGTFEKVALKLIFSDDILNELKIDTDETIEDMQKVLDRFGFVTEIFQSESEVNITFSHISFAEYFVGSYFARRKLSNIQKFIFEQRYINVRYFLDLILAKNCPAHIAVLCNNLSALRLHRNNINDKDAGGRNPLQLACSWGEKLKIFAFQQINNDFHLDSEDVQQNYNPHEYLEMVEMLCDNCDFNASDDIFGMDAMQYADKWESILALAVLETKHQINYFSKKSPDINCSSLYHFVTLGLDDFIILFKSYINRITVGSSNQTLLHVALQRGHEKVFVKLVKAGADVNIADNNSYTPLMLACQLKKEELVQLLLNSGSNVNASNLINWTSLHLACFKSPNEKIINLLIKAGADVNAFASYNQTALQIACRKGDIKVVQLFLNSEIDINARTAMGYTAVAIACEYNNKEVVKLLLTVGADVNIPNMYGITPLGFACANGNQDIAKILIDEGAKINATSLKGDTPLRFACESGNAELVDFLIQKGANVNAPNQNGDTPLRFACDGVGQKVFKTEDNSENEKVVKVLLDAKADVKTPNNNGDTPLNFACKNGNTKIVNLLITAGASINAPNKNGDTPLSFACAGGNVEVVQTLLSADADTTAVNNDGDTLLKFACESENLNVVEMIFNVKKDLNAANKHGDTPLGFACSKSNEKVVEFLIKAGFDVKKANQDGDTPLKIACENNNKKIAELLVTAGADINTSNTNGDTPIKSACSKGDTKLVELLIYAGSEVNTPNQDGDTPLMAACTSGNEEVVKLLINKKAAVDVSNKKGETAFKFACESGNEKLVELLLKTKPNVNVPNEYGTTALHYACRSGNAQMVQMLIDAEADVNACNKRGDTPLASACENAKEKIVELLIKAGATVNSTDEYGTTLLMNYCMFNSKNVVTLLINAGAEVNASNNIGYTPLAFCCLTDNVSLTRVLLEAGADPNLAMSPEGDTLLTLACRLGKNKIVKLLCDLKVDLNAPDTNGNTPFALACANGTKEIIKSLLHAGVGLNSVNNNNDTLLMFACQNGDVKLVEMLISHGADVNAENKDGNRPIMFSCRKCVNRVMGAFYYNVLAEKEDRNLPLVRDNGKEKVVGLLVKAGAEVNATNTDGKTPLLIACEDGEEEVVKVLLESEVDVNACGTNGDSPLGVARKNGHTSIVDLLVKAGAEVKHQNVN